MRLTLQSVTLATCLVAAGCGTVSNVDPRPGGLAWTEYKAITWLANDNNTMGRKAWVFVRVIAPPGATQCRGEKSVFDGPNPYEIAPVDAKGEALLTVRNAQPESNFRCRTPDGVVVSRTVASERVVVRGRDYKNTTDIENGYWAVPPLVHVGAPDAQASARWDAVIAEVCSPARPALVCRDDWMQNMKSRDLAG